MQRMHVCSYHCLKNSFTLLNIHTNTSHRDDVMFNVCVYEIVFCNTNTTTHSVRLWLSFRVRMNNVFVRLNVWLNSPTHCVFESIEFLMLWSIKLLMVAHFSAHSPSSSISAYVGVLCGCCCECMGKDNRTHSQYYLHF